MPNFNYTILPGGATGTVAAGGTITANVVPGGIIRLVWLANTTGGTSQQISSNLGGFAVSLAAIGDLPDGGGGLDPVYVVLMPTSFPPPGAYIASTWFSGAVFGGGSVSDALGFSLTFSGGTELAAGVPVVNNIYPTQANGAWILTAGQPVNIQLSALPAATSWAASQVPAGLSIDNNGLVTGFIDVAGAYQMTVVATNAAGSSAPMSFSLTVNPAAGTATSAAPLAWLPPWLIDLQANMGARSVASSVLGVVTGFTVGEDLQIAVIPRLGSYYVFDGGVTALSITIRPLGDFECSPLVVDASSVSLVSTFPVTVLTSSTGSPTVTVQRVPPNLVVGSVLLGQAITVIAGTTITLAANASATIVAATPETYTDPDPTHQYYALNFNLTSSRIRTWFQQANAAPTGPNSPLKIAAVAVLSFTYQAKSFVTESFPFPILQNIAAPDQF